MSYTVSVITIVRNAEKTIERTIKSLIGQEFKDFQYIVIDGSSTDQTLEIINKYRDFIDVLVSEPDNGTSEAFNKALTFVQGKYVLWLASDDCLGSNFLSEGIHSLETSSADLFWGAMTMYSSAGKRLGRLEQDPDIIKCMKNGKGLNFPSMMMSSEYLRLIGGLDLSLQYCNDIEWLLRAYKIRAPRNVFSNKVSVHRDDDGKVSKNFRSASWEMILVYREYQYAITPLIKTFFMRELINLFSFIKGMLRRW